MKTELEKLQKIALKVKKQIKRNDSLEIRKNILLNELRKNGYVATNISYAEKPHAGASFTVKKMSDCYRINYRCGYGKWNYAPVIEVEFKK